MCRFFVHICVCFPDQSDISSRCIQPPILWLTRRGAFPFQCSETVLILRHIKVPGQQLTRKRTQREKGESKKINASKKGAHHGGEDHSVSRSVSWPALLATPGKKTSERLISSERMAAFAFANLHGATAAPNWIWSKTFTCFKTSATPAPTPVFSLPALQFSSAVAPNTGGWRLEPNAPAKTIGLFLSTWSH